MVHIRFPSHRHFALPYVLVVSVIGNAAFNVNVNNELAQKYIANYYRATMQHRQLGHFKTNASMQLI